MLYREINAVCSEMHTKHINTLCERNIELLNVKLAVDIETTGLQKFKSWLYLMLCREIIAVCSQIHTKHINTLCGQNVELLNVILAVHIMTIYSFSQSNKMHRELGRVRTYQHPGIETTGL